MTICAFGPAFEATFVASFAEVDWTQYGRGACGLDQDDARVDRLVVRGLESGRGHARVRAVSAK